MERALALAAYAAEQDEVPIGAVVVNPENGEIVSEAYNLSEHVADASDRKSTRLNSSHRT